MTKRDTFIFMAKVIFYRVAAMFGSWCMIMYAVDFLLGGSIAVDVMDYVLFLCGINCAIKFIRMYLNSRKPVRYKLVKIDD